MSQRNNETNRVDRATQTNPTYKEFREQYTTNHLQRNLGFKDESNTYHRAVTYPYFEVVDNASGAPHEEPNIRRKKLPYQIYNPETQTVDLKVPVTVPQIDTLTKSSLGLMFRKKSSGRKYLEAGELIAVQALGDAAVFSLDHIEGRDTLQAEDMNNLGSIMDIVVDHALRIHSIATVIWNTGVYGRQLIDYFLQLMRENPAEGQNRKDGVSAAKDKNTTRVMWKFLEILGLPATALAEIDKSATALKIIDDPKLLEEIVLWQCLLLEHITDDARPGSKAEKARSKAERLAAAEALINTSDDKITGLSTEQRAFRDILIQITRDDRNRYRGIIRRKLSWTKFRYNDDAVSTILENTFDRIKSLQDIGNLLRQDIDRYVHRTIYSAVSQYLRDNRDEQMADGFDQAGPERDLIETPFYEVVEGIVEQLQLLKVEIQDAERMLVADTGIIVEALTSRRRGNDEQWEIHFWTTVVDHLMAQNHGLDRVVATNCLRNALENYEGLQELLPR